MRTFILCGNTQQPGRAGDWHSILQVQARDFAAAARKLRGKLREDPDREGKWFTPGRPTLSIVSRVLVARKRLRGKRRLEALREERARLERHYSYFRIVYLPKLA